jgi:hypothetical protein
MDADRPTLKELNVQRTKSIVKATFIGATSATIAFGSWQRIGGGTAEASRDSSRSLCEALQVFCRCGACEHERLKEAAMGGGPSAEPAPHEHHWEKRDFGRYAECVDCGDTRQEQVPLRPEPLCTPRSALHHRSCALRLGGASCTC